MSQKTVLLIEDSAYLAESVKDALEIHDYRVLVAGDGMTGVATALKEKPDFILLDIRLPDISGYEVFRTIREDDWGKKVAISILTASESIESIAKNINIPLEHILFKPNQSLLEIIAHTEKRLK